MHAPSILAAPLLAGDGSTTSLRALAAGQPLVAVFLRHFG